MRICTSIGFSRKERQLRCIESWLNLGCEVVAIQSQGEAELLKPIYPEVTFIETTLVGDLFNRPKLVRTKALLNRAVKSPVLLLNSDVEIRSTKEEFETKWRTPEPRTLKLGIRWEEDTEGNLELLKYGIDAFLITPKIALELFDIGMTIGCPAWDYWIPIHLNKLGYKFIVYKDQDLIHEVHERNWSKDDFNKGVQLLNSHYRLTLRQASDFIQNITDRRGLK